MSDKPTLYVVEHYGSIPHLEIFPVAEERKTCWLVGTHRRVLMKNAVGRRFFTDKDLCAKHLRVYVTARMATARRDVIRMQVLSNHTDYDILSFFQRGDGDVAVVVEQAVMAIERNNPA